MEGKQYLHDLLGSLGRPLPQYLLHSKGGVDHQPTFVCSCTLTDGEKTQYLSDPQSTKQKAENDAAMKAYEELKKKIRKLLYKLQKMFLLEITKESSKNIVKKMHSPYQVTLILVLHLQSEITTVVG